MFPCLKRSCSVNDLADSQALYITKNMLGIRAWPGPLLVNYRQTNRDTTLKLSES